MRFKDWFLIHVPPPEYMAMSHVGVDISPVSIHVVELVKKEGHITLGTFGTHRLPQMIDRSQPLISQPGLLEALKGIKELHNLTFVEVAIPEELAYLYTTVLPYGDEATIRSHIEMHLEENVPLSLADAVFDYHFIEDLSQSTVMTQKVRETDGGDKQSVTLDTIKMSGHKKTFSASISVVPRNIIDQYIEAFELAGMTPVSFLIENQALSKSIIRIGDTTTRMIVHVGEKKTVLSIVSNTSVQFTSTIHIGSEDFTNAIMKAYGVSQEEAIRMKTEKGLRLNNDESIFMSLINLTSTIKDEIDRIGMYWQSYIDKYPGKHKVRLSSIVLSGRDALIQGFKEYLSSTVRLPVETANVWTNIYDLEKKIPEIEYIDSLDYASAIGLALPKISDNV